MKAYADSDVVSAISKDDHPAESAALDAVLVHAEAGKLEIVTSALTRIEADRYQGPHSKGVQRVARLIAKVHFIEDHAVYGFQDDPFAGGSSPLVANEPTASALREMGLDQMDAHHVMLAITAGCDVFVTCDAKTILKHRAGIEADFPIRVMKPSELVRLL